MELSLHVAIVAAASLFANGAMAATTPRPANYSGQELAAGAKVTLA